MLHAPGFVTTTGSTPPMELLLLFPIILVFLSTSSFYGVTLFQFRRTNENSAVFPRVRIEQVAPRPDFTTECSHTDMKGKKKQMRLEGTHLKPDLSVTVSKSVL